MAAKVKICGITNYEDAQAAVSAGADALGFVFYKKSPRYVSSAKAARMVRSLPPLVSAVGVFVNASAAEIETTARACGLSAVQLHGDESPKFCRGLARAGFRVIKAFRVREDFDPSTVASYKECAFLFDAFSDKEYGGTGKAFNWRTVSKLNIKSPVILAGGLTPANVRRAILEVRPFAVDVSSGVERCAGKKDGTLMKAFIRQARSVR